jgi:hypothetical protein
LRQDPSQGWRARRWAARSRCKGEHAADRRHRQPGAGSRRPTMSSACNDSQVAISHGRAQRRGAPDLVIHVGAATIARNEHGGAPAAPAAAGTMAETRGRPTCRPSRSSGAAVDRRARQPRIVQSRQGRRAGGDSWTRVPRAETGLQRRCRRRDRRLQRAVCRAVGASATRTQFIVIH